MMATVLTDTGGTASRTWFRLPDERGPLVSALVFVLAAIVLMLVSPSPITYFDVSNISASATTLALAAIGLTIVVLTGGLDLSGVAVISLVNVVIVSQLGNSEMPTAAYTAAAAGLSIGLGALIGAVNGYLVGYLRLQSIVVTLGVMFICQGAALASTSLPEAMRSVVYGVILLGAVLMLRERQSN